MITKSALPPPDFIESALSELRKRKTLEELKHLGSPNRIRVWTDDASSMTVTSLVKIAEYAEEMNLDTISYWKEVLFASDWPVVTLQEEWHEPKRTFVCLRVTHAEPGNLIVYAGELCRYKPNSKGVPHCLSLFSDELHEMDGPPKHVVIGKLYPLEEGK